MFRTFSVYNRAEDLFPNNSNWNCSVNSAGNHECLAVVLHVVGIGDIETHSADPRYQRAMDHRQTGATNLRSNSSNGRYLSSSNVDLFYNMDRNWFRFANLRSKELNRMLHIPWFPEPELSANQWLLEVDMVRQVCKIRPDVIVAVSPPLHLWFFHTVDLHGAPPAIIVTHVLSPLLQRRHSLGVQKSVAGKLDVLDLQSSLDSCTCCTTIKLLQLLQLEVWTSLHSHKVHYTAIHQR